MSWTYLGSIVEVEAEAALFIIRARGSQFLVRIWKKFIVSFVFESSSFKVGYVILKNYLYV